MTTAPLWRLGLLMACTAACAELTYAPADVGVDLGRAEAGSDAGSDVASDVGADAGADAGDDAGVDAGTDVGTDSGTDVGTDVGTDTGMDAGCSADLGTDPMNCGQCGRVCMTPRGTLSNACVGGVCVPTCASAFGNCNGNPVDGCEAELNTEDRCGSCVTVCTSGQACLPPPMGMSGSISCVMCGRRNMACCRAPTAPCESGLRCDGMICVQ